MEETNLGKATNTKKVNSRRAYSKQGQQTRQDNNTVKFNLDKAETAREKKSIQNICTDKERRELKMNIQRLTERIWQNKKLNLGLSRPGYYCSHGAVVAY